MRIVVGTVKWAVMRFLSFFAVGLVIFSTASLMASHFGTPAPGGTELKDMPVWVNGITLAVAAGWLYCDLYFFLGREKRTQPAAQTA